ncbi:oncoprotein-induced transcript 3 protein-like [Watersipora subatra]|uniref:oncoprotein-induced transcript 3 protein-like n=1 Tax=Watersipora subatra TaxID=2589382 RepID=UPI00355BDD20
MKSYFAIVLTLLVAASASQDLYKKNELKDTNEEKINIIMSRVNMHCHAMTEHQPESRKKRAVDLLHAVLLQALVDCQEENGDANPTTPAPTESAEDDELDPCSFSLTVNLTEYWRRDDEGSNIRPVNDFYACDRSLQGNTQWFRFQGAAGQQLSNRCAPAYSCGGHGGFWSNAEMPSEPGEVRSVPIYGSWTGNCRWYTWPVANPLTVKRCSNRSGDFVYKVQGTSSCYWTFCGMDIVN